MLNKHEININNFYKFILIILISGLTNSCTDFKQVIGNEKYIPDEYVVIKTPKLTMPPGFGNENNDLFKKNNEERDSILTLDNVKSDNKDLQSLFNSDGVPNNIRELVDEETRGVGLSERTGLDYLFDRIPDTGVVLDSEKETLRLKKNKKESLPILSGPSPSIDVNTQKNINVK